MLFQMDKPTLSVSSSIPWDGVLDWVGEGKLNVSVHLPLLTDQRPPIFHHDSPCTMNETVKLWTRIKLPSFNLLDIL